MCAGCEKPGAGTRGPSGYTRETTQVMRSGHRGQKNGPLRPPPYDDVLTKVTSNEGVAIYENL